MGDAAAAARRYTDPLRRHIPRTCAAWSTPARWPGAPDCTGLGDATGSDAGAGRGRVAGLRPQTPFIAFHALLVLAAANDPAAIRAIDVPGATEEQATTLRLIGEGLIALNDGEPRAALDCLLESLSGLPSIGGSRVQQEVVLETALAAMLNSAPGPGRPPVVPVPQHTRPAGDPRCGELT